MGCNQGAIHIKKADGASFQCFSFAKKVFAAGEQKMSSCGKRGIFGKSFLRKTPSDLSILILLFNN
jgi:hypothetical protein